MGFFDRFSVSRKALNSLKDHEERLEAIERRYRDLEAEWAGVYEKFSRLLAAQRTREQRSNGGAPPPVSPVEDMQNRILARRRADVRKGG